MKRFLLIFLAIVFCTSPVFAQTNFTKDVIKTDQGDLVITFIGHAAMIFSFRDMNIYIDPFSRIEDYARLPDADLIFLTHHHRDHLDLDAMNLVRTPETVVVMTQTCSITAKAGLVMNNGDKRIISGITVEAIPAYNLVHRDKNGEFYHPKGICNGYVLTIGDKRIYIAGDTENTPEMKALKDIDIAFLPLNLPYTMTPEMAADATRAFKPKVLYPYHYSDTDPNKLVALLKDTPVEIRIRPMK